MSKDKSLVDEDLLRESRQFINNRNYSLDPATAYFYASIVLHDDGDEEYRIGGSVYIIFEVESGEAEYFDIGDPFFIVEIDDNGFIGGHGATQEAVDKIISESLAFENEDDGDDDDDSDVADDLIEDSPDED